MLRQIAIKASEGHRSFGKLLKRVYSSDEHLIVERDGFPVAVLMSYQEYQKLLREHALASHRETVRELGEQAERQGLTEEGLMAQLEETKRQVYRETYGQDPT